jgi:outer membrane receptor protein involved in Fe transport
MRNATDEEYKTGVTFPAGTPYTNVEVGDPRTFGISVSAKF